MDDDILDFYKSYIDILKSYYKNKSSEATGTIVIGPNNKIWYETKNSNSEVLEYYSIDETTGEKEYRTVPNRAWCA